MKLSMPKTFKPDPSLSAEAAQRIQQKADLQSVSTAQSAGNEQSANTHRPGDTVRNASDALSAASYLPVGMKARAGLMVASYAANKFADKYDKAVESRQEGQLNKTLSHTNDIARSMPDSTKAMPSVSRDELLDQRQSDGPQPG